MGCGEPTIIESLKSSSASARIVVTGAFDHPIHQLRRALCPATLKPAVPGSGAPNRERDCASLLAKCCKSLAMRPSLILSAQRTHVLALAAARGASRVRVFGPVAKGLDRADSDLDLLVDLPAGTSLLTVVGLQQDISDALGIVVDLCTEPELQPDLKERILAQARAL